MQHEMTRVTRVARVCQLQRLSLRAEVNVRVDRVPSSPWDVHRLDLHYFFLFLFLPLLLLGRRNTQRPLTNLTPLIVRLDLRLDTVRTHIRSRYRLGSDLG